MRRQTISNILSIFWITAFFFGIPITMLAQLPETLILGKPKTGKLERKLDKRYHVINVEVGQHLFIVLDDTSSGANQNELYIKFGSLPTREDFDAKFDATGPDQAVEILNTQAGTYFIMVFAAATVQGTGEFIIAATTIVSGVIPVALKITPNPATVTVGKRIQLRAVGIDAKGNDVTITPIWETDAGQIDANGFLIVQTTPARGKTVTARFGGLPGATVGGISGTLTFDVVTGPLDRVVIDLPSAKLVLSGTQQFTTQGFDAFGNEIPDLTLNWSVVNGGGDIDEIGLFTALVKGFHPQTVKAEAIKDGVTKSATASIDVTQPVKVEVRIAEAVFPDGYFYQFTVRNVGMENIGEFNFNYTGNEGNGENGITLIHISKLSDWSVAGKPDGKVRIRGGPLRPGKTITVEFTLSAKIAEGDWIARNTATYHVDFGTFADATTPPPTPRVQDEGDATASTTRLRAFWTVDDSLKVIDYEYAIGTTLGGTDVIDWTRGGRTSFALVEGLSLEVGQTYYFAVRAKNGAGLTSAVGVSDGITVTLTDLTFTADIPLSKGLNLISLPLNPDQPHTASSLAEALETPIVIRIENGRYDAYVHDRQIGTNFLIEMGKGYIVNVSQEKSYPVTGKPWGVPAAPPNSTTSELWAFVVAGRIDGTLPIEGQLRVINLRTGESVLAPILPNGEFTAAFVDMSKRSVVVAGDEIATQLITTDGSPRSEIERHIILPEATDRAYILTRLSTMPNQTRLLQNYPNPFNPDTWIPLKLAQATTVKIEIYDLNGHLTRHLDLGHRVPGWYVSKDRAAYWDGRNQVGERVSSGIYFYRLQAGNFSTQRKLVVAK